MGTRDGDIVRALSWDATYSGETTIQAGIANTLTMTMISSRRRVSADIEPHYVRHLPHADGRGIDLQVVGLGAGARLDGTLTVIGGDENASAPLGPNIQHNEYRGTLVPNFSEQITTLDGFKPDNE